MTRFFVWHLFLCVALVSSLKQLDTKLLGFDCGCGSRGRILQDLNFKIGGMDPSIDTTAEIRLKIILISKKRVI